ncbi:MAG: hypothetical protein SGBAC_006109 [Bacillariaceae sp.]
MIDETNISPTTSTCSGGDVKTSADKTTATTPPMEEIVPLATTAAAATGEAEEQRDMMDMLLSEQASDEFRVLVEDEGSDEVELVTELTNDSESSDEWSDGEDEDESQRLQPEDCLTSPNDNNLAKDGVVVHDDDDHDNDNDDDYMELGEVVGDTDDLGEDHDNQSTDEWGEEQKVSFEKVMDVIAFPVKHLFPPEEEGIEVDNELGVVNSDSQYGDHDQELLVQEEKKEEKEIEPEKDEEKQQEERETAEVAVAKSTSASTLTVDTSVDDSNGKPSSVPSTSSMEAAEDSKKTTADIEDEESVEVVLPANDDKTQRSSAQKTTTPLISPTSPRQWFSSWFQPGPDQRIVATVTKASKKEPLGVFIKKVLLKDGLYVSQLQAGSEIASTGLKPGMKILTINGKPCPQTVKDFRELVSSMEGQVDIVAQPPENENEGLVVVTIFKETKTQPLGLILKRQMFREGLVVAKVLDGSIFCHTDLKEGMRIVRVNDQQCPGTVDAFRGLLSEIDGQVKIVAEPTVTQSQTTKPPANDEENERTDDNKREESKEPQEESTNAVTFVTDNTLEVPPMTKIFKHNGVERKEIVCKVTKNGTHESLGLLLRDFKDEEGIHVLQLDENSKLGATALKPGMTIHQINGQDCPNKVEECVKMLRSIDGPLTIVASELYED